MASRLTPISRAILRASGDDRRRPPPSTTRRGAGAATGAVRSMRGAFISIASAYSPVVCFTESFLSVTRRCCGSSFFSTLPPGALIVASVPPTGIICPSFASTDVMVPSSSASRSRLTLSVSISSTGSPRFTASPCFLYQRTTFPSVIASPILGMMISAIRVENAFDRVRNLLLMWSGEQFEIARVRHRHILAADALDRRVEIIECVLSDARRDFGSGTEWFPLLLHNDAAMRLRDRGIGRNEIERQDRTQVDDFAFDAFVL